MGNQAGRGAAVMSGAMRPYRYRVGRPREEGGLAIGAEAIAASEAKARALVRRALLAQGIGLEPWLDYRVPTLAMVGPRAGLP